MRKTITFTFFGWSSDLCSCFVDFVRFCLKSINFFSKLSRIDACSTVAVKYRLCCICLRYVRSGGVLTLQASIDVSAGSLSLLKEREQMGRGRGGWIMATTYKNTTTIGWGRVINQARLGGIISWQVINKWRHIAHAPSRYRRIFHSRCIRCDASEAKKIWRRRHELYWLPYCLYIWLASCFRFTTLIPEAMMALVTVCCVDIVAGRRIKLSVQCTVTVRLFSVNWTAVQQK